MASDTLPDFRRRRLLFGGANSSPDPPANPVAVIAESCLAFRGITCMACRDACPTGAIRFVLALGGALLVFFGVALLSVRLVGPFAWTLGWPAKKIGGVAGSLARDNSRRNPQRTASTASALRRPATSRA